MATSPPRPAPAPESPGSGDRAETPSLAAAVQAAPARLWGSLFGRRPPLPGGPKPSAADATISPSPAAASPTSIPKDVVQHTLSNLHSIRKSILFWKSIDMGTDSQKVYYMILQRGPRAFVETTCQTLARLGRNRSPVQHLLNSSSDMIATKLGVLTRMQHCLASFLAEVYYEFDKLIDGSRGSSDKLLHALFIVLNTAFSKLEVALTNASELSSHKKPRKMTIYWLPYTCGALGLSACSLWLFYHSSLMGGSDIGNWIHGAKDLLVGYWDENVQKPIVSMRHLTETLQKSVPAKQEVHLTEDPLRNWGNFSSFLHKRYEKYPIGPTHPIQSFEQLACIMLDQEQKRAAVLKDLHRALVGLYQIHTSEKIIIYACGRWLLLLVLLVRTRAMHGQRIRTSQRKRRLLSDVEKRLAEFRHCMVNGKEQEARCKFGLTLYGLDRLLKCVKSHAKKSEWTSVRESASDLASTGRSVAYKQTVLKFLGSCSCLLPPSSDLRPL